MKQKLAFLLFWGSWRQEINVWNALAQFEKDLEEYGYKIVPIDQKQCQCPTEEIK